MQHEPKLGMDLRMVVSLPVQGRPRPEDVLRRKLMQKMITRRERRLASAMVPARRAG